MKKLFLTTLSLILLGGGATVLYLFFLKDYEIEDNEVKEITSEEYVIELPDEVDLETEDEITSPETEAPQSEENSVSTNKQNTEGNEGNEDYQEKPKDPPNPTKDEVPVAVSSNTTTEDGQTIKTSKKEKQQPTSEKILQKYKPSFESLQAQANSKINSLISRAINEYKTKKANGEKIKFSYFFQKYKTAGDELESKTDIAFHTLYAALQKELEKNGLSKDEALVVKDAYDEEKKKRESALFNKALSQLK